MSNEEADGRPRKVLVTAWGTRGDCQSAVSVGAALATRGHDVRFAGPGFMAAECVRAAIPFVAMGDDPLEWFRAKPSRRRTDPRLVLPRLLPVFVRQVEQQFSTLRDIGRDVDVVIGQGLAYAAPSIAEWAGAPYHYLSPNVFLFPSRHHPPLSSKRATMPAWVNRLSWGQFSLFYNVMFRRKLNRHREALGLAPVRNVATHVFDASRGIAAFDPELYSPPPDVADVLPHAPVGSIPVPADASGLDAATESFLGAGGPVVAVDFGSMPDHAPERTTTTLIDGARRAGARLIVSSGWAGLGRSVGEQDANDVHVVDSISHAGLFPRVDVVVHHGGVGTAASAARAGAAQVIVPHAYDQYASAHRLRQAGVTHGPLPRSKLDASSFGDALGRILGDDELRQRARVIGESISNRDPLRETVDIITASW